MFGLVFIHRLQLQTCVNLINSEYYRKMTRSTWVVGVLSSKSVHVGRNDKIYETVSTEYVAIVALKN